MDKEKWIKDLNLSYMFILNELYEIGKQLKYDNNITCEIEKLKQKTKRLEIDKRKLEIQLIELDELELT